MADLRGQQIKDRYETLLTTSVTTANPTTGIVQNGNGNPFTTLTVAGVPLGAGGLDSYETGTWTPGISFGNASVGITYSNNSGLYTKIGRMVTVTGLVVLSNKGSSTGSARITGLPFAVGNGLGYYSAASLRVNGVTFANQIVGWADINSTDMLIQQMTEAGGLTDITDIDFSNSSGFIISLTYFI